MKTTIRQIGMCLALGAGLIACGGTSSDSKLSEPEVLKEYTLNPENAQAIITDYLALKDALVQTDQMAATTAASSLLSKLPAENASVSDMRKSAKKIASSTDIETQRTHFENLSAQVYSMVLSTGANESSLYVQYCPMAFDNKGASWLSAEKQVNNPYFGDVMLHCGKVESTIDAGAE